MADNKLIEKLKLKDKSRSKMSDLAKVKLQEVSNIDKIDFEYGVGSNESDVKVCTNLELG